MSRENIALILKQKRKSLKLSVEDVVTRLKEYDIDISIKSIYNYESAHRQPDADTLMALCEIYKIKDVMETFGYKPHIEQDDTATTQISKNELTHIKKYRVLDEHGKKIIDTNLNIEYDRMQRLLAEPAMPTPKPHSVKGNAQIIILPEPLQPASAGTGDFADDDTAEEVPVLYNTSTAKADYIMRVHGDSMEPDIQDGDRLLVRRQPAVDIGETGIFIHEGERFVKIFQGDCLKSANADYKDIPVSEYTICIGKVIDVLDPDWIVK